MFNKQYSSSEGPYPWCEVLLTGMAREVRDKKVKEIFAAR